MKIITEAGIEIDESQIDVEYAKRIIRSMVRIISIESDTPSDAIKDFERVQQYIEQEKEWQECQAAFEADGYTGADVTAYLDSRVKHDPMDDDPNRDRNSQ